MSVFSAKGAASMPSPGATPVIPSGVEGSRSITEGSVTGFLDSARNDAYEMPSTMCDKAPLLCPRCKVPLKEVRTSGGVFYGCNVCGGRAVTIELLRKRFTPE